MKVGPAGGLTIGVNLVDRLVVDTGGALCPAVADSQVLGTAAQPWQAVYARDGMITTSDARLKVDVLPSPLGLDFIRALEPVAYRWKSGGSAVQTGFIAQQVHACIPEGLEWAGWQSKVADAVSGDHLEMLRYDAFVAPLVRAIQTLADKLEQIQL